jgi:uncharacterized Fe-S cluster-containing radical SAM superfamily enzyme
VLSYQLIENSRQQKGLGRSTFVTLLRPATLLGVEPHIFQRVPEGKVAKNRAHLDVHVDEEQKLAEVERLTAWGARHIETHADRGPTTYVMQDPEGNEFCLH